MGLVLVFESASQVWETQGNPFAGMGQMITCSTGTLFVVLLNVSDMVAAGFTMERVLAYLNSDYVSVKGYAALPPGCSVYVPWGMLAVPVGIPTRWCDGVVSFFVQLLNCVEDMVGVASVSAHQQIKVWSELSLARTSKVSSVCRGQAQLILKEAEKIAHRPDPTDEAIAADDDSDSVSLN